MFFSKCLLRNSSGLQNFFLKKDWAGALTFLEANQSKIKIPVEELDGLMSRLYSNHKYIDTYKLLLLMPSYGKQPDEIDYTLAIEACLEQSKIVQAINIFYQSQIFGVTLDACLYSNLVTMACNKDTGVRNIKWILRCAQRDNSTISIQAAGAVIKFATKIKDSALIEIILKLMYEAKYNIPNKIIATHLNRNISDSAEYKSLKNLWNDIQVNFYNEPNFEKEKKTENNYNDNLKVSSKYPMSFELIVVPQDGRKSPEVLDSSNYEDSSSD